MPALYIAIGAALVCFILYALDRRLRKESIDWVTAAKFLIIGGLLGGGIAYAVSPTEIAAELVKALPEAPAVQEMFVGVPTF